MCNAVEHPYPHLYTLKNFFATHMVFSSGLKPLNRFCFPHR